MKPKLRQFLIILLLMVPLVGLSGIASINCAPRAIVAGEQKGNPDTKVWVNTGSGVYHCPGTRWYGKTKQGEYMTQKQALEKGNRPAYGKYCD